MNDNNYIKAVHSTTTNTAIIQLNKNDFGSEDDLIIEDTKLIEKVIRIYFDSTPTYGISHYELIRPIGWPGFFYNDPLAKSGLGACKIKE